MKFSKSIYSELFISYQLVSWWLNQAFCSLRKSKINSFCPRLLQLFVGVSSRFLQPLVYFFQEKLFVKFTNIKMLCNIIHICFCAVSHYMNTHECELLFSVNRYRDCSSHFFFLFQVMLWILPYMYPVYFWFYLVYTPGTE